MALLLLRSLVYSLGIQDKARVDTFTSWLLKLKHFDKMENAAFLDFRDDRKKLTEKLNSIDEEKRIFLNEIEVEEIDLRNFLTTCYQFLDEILSKTTLEEINSVLEEMEQHIYVGNKTDFVDHLVTAIDKYILEKTNKLTLPPEKLLP